jgi:NAD-dependent deacetylase
MRVLPHDRVFVLTGAGVSADSGHATFRDSGGLWSGHRVEDVATPEAWEANPALVWRFYSQRRRDALAVQPNPGHIALARFEQRLFSTAPDRFFLCTQNVDDLHERAVSQRVHHMHGSLFQSRCERCNKPFADQNLYEDPDHLPTCSTCGSLLRPNIVWFGEIPHDMDLIYRELDRATILLVVGTSGSVYPAAGLVQIAKAHNTRTVYVGPERPLNSEFFTRIQQGKSSEVLPSFLEDD